MSNTSRVRLCFFFFNDTATTEIYTLSLHDALPILRTASKLRLLLAFVPALLLATTARAGVDLPGDKKLESVDFERHIMGRSEEHTSNSSHSQISYAVFRLKKTKTEDRDHLASGYHY